jgi:hypothetical protein
MDTIFTADQLNDTGQDFVLECTNYPREDVPITRWQTVAFDNSERALRKVFGQVADHPQVIHTRIRQRSGSRS